MREGVAGGGGGGEWKEGEEEEEGLVQFLQAHRVRGMEACSSPRRSGAEGGAY